MRLRLCGSNGTPPALAASHHSQERAPPPTTNLLFTEAHPSTAVGPLWSPSTLLRCAAKRMRTASGLGEAAAKLRGRVRAAMCGRADVSRRRFSGGVCLACVASEVVLVGAPILVPAHGGE